jgi:sulfur-carrier protein
MPVVKFFANLRRLAGAAQFNTLALTVGDALEAVCMDNPRLRAAIFQDACLKPHVRVMVNGRDVELAQGLETPLGADDEVAVFPPIAGGSQSCRGDPVWSPIF